MRPLVLVSTIIATGTLTERTYRYLQLLSVQRCQQPPQAERSCLWGGVPTPPAAERCCWGGGSAMPLDVQGGYRAVCGRSGEACLDFKDSASPLLEACGKVQADHTEHPRQLAWPHS